MSGAEVPKKIQRRIAAVERRIGRRIIVRGAKWPDPSLRGRVSERAGAIIIEYRDDVAGYFWHIDIISELLDHVEQGHFEISLTDRPRRTIAEPPRLGPDE